MYKNLKYNTEFISLPWVLCWLDVMTKCNRYLTVFIEITLCIRIENDMIVMESNDHLKISCSPFL
jgi:hypothetical protein